MSETLEPALPDELDGQAERLMRKLCDRNLTVATAESCTGGMLAALLTDIEGAGHGFDRGFVESPASRVPPVPEARRVWSTSPSLAATAVRFIARSISERGAVGLSGSRA